MPGKEMDKGRKKPSILHIVKPCAVGTPPKENHSPSSKSKRSLPAYRRAKGAGKSPCTAQAQAAPLRRNRIERHLAGSSKRSESSAQRGKGVNHSGCPCSRRSPFHIWYFSAFPAYSPHGERGGKEPVGPVRTGAALAGFGRWGALPAAGCFAPEQAGQK